MKPLIVGEKPSKNVAPGIAVEGRIGHRLADFCCIGYEAFLETFERVNMLEFDEYPFDMRKAREAATVLLPRFRDRIVIVLGKRAARALGLPQIEYFVWQAHGGGRVVIVPHPSGRNRWYNDIDNEFQMMHFMRELTLAVRNRQ